MAYHFQDIMAPCVDGFLLIFNNESITQTQSLCICVHRFIISFYYFTPSHQPPKLPRLLYADAPFPLSLPTVAAWRMVNSNRPCQCNILQWGGVLAQQSLPWMDSVKGASENKHPPKVFHFTPPHSAAPPRWWGFVFTVAVLVYRPSRCGQGLASWARNQMVSWLRCSIPG